MSRELPSKLYSLDVLRGIAAISVVFWHWQHYFYVGDQPKNFISENQPFFGALSLLYRHGDSAVELFFCISGFIFYWLYSQPIADKKISIKEFSVKRFSRLYPLYITTFFVVLFLQGFYLSRNGSYFVYQENDLYHAILNILMIPAWGFESGWSFNAPVWSVSIEIMLYCVFFIICRLGKIRLALIPILILVGYLIFPENYKIGIGLFSFFCGAATYKITKLTINNLTGFAPIILSSILLAFAWYIVSAFFSSNIFVITSCGFTTTIYFLVTLSTIPVCNNMFAKIRWIGDISYSSYLIHFPLQIIFALCYDFLGYRREIFYSSSSIIIFMMTLIPLSLISHYYLETHAQRYIRNKIMGKIITKSILKQG